MRTPFDACTLIVSEGGLTSIFDVCTLIVSEGGLTTIFIVLGGRLALCCNVKFLKGVEAYNSGCLLCCKLATHSSIDTPTGAMSTVPCCARRLFDRL